MSLFHTEVINHQIAKITKSLQQKVYSENLYNLAYLRDVIFIIIISTQLHTSPNTSCKPIHFTSLLYM